MAPIDRHDNCAVVFSDISGSTKLYVEVGDERARQIVARTLDLWSVLTTEGGGNVVQLRGDGMLCIFPTADAALTAVVRMRDLPYQEPLSMHAGLHVGAILQEAEQLYGDVVNVAARMADIAKRFEVVMTAAAQQQLTNAARWRNLRLIRGVPVKGKPEPMDVYLLAHDTRALTDYRPPPRKTAAGRLTLRYAGTAHLMEPGAAACVIGRDDACQIKIDHRLASRRHASIECSAGKFFLHDHSTNGTYVSEQQSAPVLVHRELYQLKTSGVISVGVEPQLNIEHSVTYFLEETRNG
jgi:class 3 adenylate cyclase